MGWRLVNMGFQVTTTTIYLLFIEITVLFGALTAWFIHHSNKMPGTGKRKSNLTLNELENQPLAPRGWPNYRPKSPPRRGKPDVTEAMYALMECIMMEKRLITEGDLHLKHTDSYGPHINDATYTGSQPVRLKSKRKTQPAQPAANDEEIDIIDVFGRSKNVLKYSKQGQVASEQAVFRKHESDLSFRQCVTKEILQPWGW